MSAGVGAASPATVVAKARKRCPGCHRMVEAGSPALLTDDREIAGSVLWHGRTFVRGSWHLWHPGCREASLAAAEAALARLRAQMNEELAASIAELRAGGAA